MLFSFANLALSFWLGFIALACIRWVWRAATDHDNGYPGRDRSRVRSTSENYPNHEPKDRRARHLVSAGARSLVSISREIVNIFRAAFNRIIRSFWELPWSATRPPAPPTSPVLPLIPEAQPASPKVEPKSDAPNEAPLSRSSEAGKRKRAVRASARTSEIQSDSPAAEPRKSRPKPTETDASIATRPAKRQSEKRFGTTSRTGGNTAKKTLRTKSKIAVATNVGAASKITI